MQEGDRLHKGADKFDTDDNLDQSCENNVKNHI